MLHQKLLFQNVQQERLDQIVSSAVMDTVQMTSHVIKQLEGATLGVNLDTLENCVTQVTNM